MSQQHAQSWSSDPRDQWMVGRTPQARALIDVAYISAMYLKKVRCRIVFFVKSAVGE